jgi:hypothetical protein
MSLPAHPTTKFHAAQIGKAILKKTGTHNLHSGLGDGKENIKFEPITQPKSRRYINIAAK